MEAPLIDSRFDDSNNESGIAPGGSGNRLSQGPNLGSQIYEVSDLGSLIQRDQTNNSILRYRVDRFGVNPNGVVNLGMAQHLFIPNDVSIIQARGNTLQTSSYMDQSSIQGGATSNSNFMSSQGYGGVIGSDRLVGTPLRQPHGSNQNSSLGTIGQLGTSRSGNENLGKTYIIDQNQSKYLNMTVELLQQLDPKKSKGN